MESMEHDDLVDEEEIEKSYVILMIELANTDSHQNAVMVKFVNASLAFVAMPHSDPLVQSTHLAKPLLFEHAIDIGMAVLLVAKGIVFYYQEMKDRSH